MSYLATDEEKLHSQEKHWANFICMVSRELGGIYFIPDSGNSNHSIKLLNKQIDSGIYSKF